MADYPTAVTTELTLLSRVAYRDQEITSRRLRGLLALLAGDLRTGCGTARLVEGLWPDQQPENPTKALQVLASAVLLSASASARCSRAGDHEAALVHAEAGLALYEAAECCEIGYDQP